MSRVSGNIPNTFHSSVQYYITYQFCITRIFQLLAERWWRSESDEDSRANHRYHLGGGFETDQDRKWNYLSKGAWRRSARYGTFMSAAYNKIPI